MIFVSVVPIEGKNHMDYQKTLAFTGSGIMVGGYLIGDRLLITLAILLVATGAIIARVVFRRKRAAHDAS